LGPCGARREPLVGDVIACEEVGTVYEAGIPKRPERVCPVQAVAFWPLADIAAPVNSRGDLMNSVPSTSTICQKRPASAGLFFCRIRPAGPV